MKNLNLFRKSARGSEGSTLVSTVVRPSFDCRSTVVKHLAFMLLFLLGSLNVWGEDVTVSLTSWTQSISAYNSTVWTDNGCSFTYASNNQTKWAYVRCGGKNTSATSTIKYNSKVTVPVDYVVLNTSNGINGSSGYNVTITGISVSAYSNAACTSLVSSADLGTLAYTNSNCPTSITITPTTAWAKDLYYVISISWTETGNKNGGLNVSGITFHESTGGGGSSNPTISVDPESATYGVNDVATALSVTATASDGDLSYEWYSNSSESTAGATKVAETETYTPSTSDAGTTYYYCIVTDANGSATSGFAAIEVKAKHNIIFDTDLKSIANVSVMEGETYNITETIEAALIASCTYTKFEGWTTATSIADASVKPSLVSSVTMSTADVTLKPVFSKTTGGGGSSEKTAHLTESEMRTNLNSSATAYSTTTETSYDDTSDGVEWAGKFSANAGGYWVQLRQNATPAYLKISADGNISEVKVTVTSSNNKSGGQYDMTTGYNNFNSSVNLYLSTENVAGSENANVVASAATGTGISYIELTLTPSSADNSELYLISSGGCRVWLVDVTYSTGGGGTTTYSLDPGCAAAGQCYAPTFTPEAGTFDAAQNVELACATDGATIRYTIDGSAPSKTEGTVYSSAIAISANTTIKAIAYKDGMTDSEIAEGVFNIRCAQPTFSPAGGDYDEAKNVTILADGADAIYYAIGETPTIDEEHKYTAPIAINTTGSHTINAIAVKAGYANSNVASATYVMDLPYANIAAFIAAAPTTAKSLTLNNAIITGVDGTTLYIQDETAGIMIYGLASLPENAAPNHSISGTIVGKYSSYKNQHELVKPNNTTPIDISDVTISADEVARPAINEYTSLSAAYDAKPMMLVKLTDVSYDGTQYEFSGNKIYNTFGALTDKTMPETTVDCDITGVVINYNGTLELLPVFATDIVADADAADPTVSPAGGADAENAVTAAAVEITAAANTKVNGLDATTIDINSAIPTEVTVEVTRDFYRSVNYSCGWYKAAAAKYNINGQGATPEGTVVAKVAGVEAATAAEGDEVHVFITPNAHFHLASILVNGAAPAEVTAGEEYSFEMPDEAVTIAVTWTEDAKYALTFAAGEGSGDAPAISGNEYYAGESITLPANTFTYDAQHKFTKWLIGGTEYAAGASYTMPAEAKEAVAQWKTIPAFASGDWILVEDVDELTEGSYVIIAAAEDYDYAMIPYSSGGNNCGRNAAVKNGKLLTYNAAFAIFEIKNFVQEEVVTGKSFMDITNDTYLYSPSANNYLKTKVQQDVYAAWNIEISEGTLTAFNKGNTAYEIQYNTSGMFSCYKSTQQAISLYKYHVPSLKLSYDKNTTDDVTNLPGMQVADGENKVTVSSEVPLRENYIFNGWKDGESNDHAAGAEITLSANMTLYAQWRTPETVTISYDANEGNGSMNADPDQVEGSTYTIKANEFERNGYLFAGWKAYDANDDELEITNGKFTVPATNVTVKAQWQSATDSKWVLVEHLSQLADGDKVIIAAADYDYALGAEAGSTNKYRAPEAANKDGKLLIPTAGATQLTLGKSGDYYTFRDGDNYLMWSSGNTLPTEASASDNSLWTISFEEGVMHIVNKTNENRLIQYNDNSGQERFAAYTGSQKAVVIYKYLDIDPEDATSGYEREDLVLSGIGTICLPYDVKASDRFGGVFYMPSHKTSGFANFIEETGTLRAGKAYIFVAENEFIRLKYSGAEVSEPLSDEADTRGLIGTFTNIAPGNLTHKYVIANNKLMECGSGAYLNAYRAYLDLDAMPEEALVINDGPSAAPRRRLGVGGNAPQVATGVENVQGDNVQCTKVLINGQLYIMYNGTMYNVQGQLVK